MEGVKRKLIYSLFHSLENENEFDPQVGCQNEKHNGYRTPTFSEAISLKRQKVALRMTFQRPSTDGHSEY